MDGELIFTALLSFGLFLSLIAVLFRITRQEAAISWMIGVFVAAGVVVGAVHAGSWGVTQYVWWASLYSLFTTLFVFVVFSFMEASLTVRIFTEIARSGMGITTADFMKHHNRLRIVGRRIARLLYSGEIVKNQGMYTRGKTSYFEVREIFLEFLRRVFPPY
jgi:hypothetical protein